MTDTFGGGDSLGSASGSIELDASGALKSLDAVRSGLQGMERQAEGTSKGILSFASANEQHLNTIGAGLLGVGAAFLGAFGLATKTAMDFDAQISAVGSVAGATEEQLASLRDEALRLGADTTFSASEAASGMEVMLKAGASLESVLNGGTEAVLNLSAATGVDVPLAAETAATAMNTFGVSAEEAADTIAQSANASSLDVNDWALALKSVGPVAASLGLSMDDLAAAMVILGDAGIKGEVGATALRNILLGIADPASEGAEALNEWGVATHDASGNMRSLADITNDLAGSWDTMSQSQKIALAEQVAGKDGVAAFMAVMDAQTEAVKNNSDAFDDASKRMDATGTVSEQAAARMDNLKGSWEQLMGTVETAMITFTSGLAPAMRKVVDGVNDLLQRVLKLPSPIKTATAAFAGITGALALVSGGFLLMLPRIASTVSAFRALGGISGILTGLTSSFGLLLSPIGLVAIAAAALAFIFRDELKAAVDWIVDTFKEITDAFKDFREMGVDPVDAALAALQVTFPAFGAAIGSIRQLVDNLRDAFEALKDGDFAAMFESVGAAARNVGSAILNAVRAIDWSAVGGALLDGLASLAGWVAGYVLDLGILAVSVAGWLAGAIPDVWAWLRDTAIPAIGDGLVSLPGVLVDVANWAKGVLPDIWAWLQGIVTGGSFGDGTGGATAGAVGGISLADVLVNISNWAKGTVSDIYEAIKGWIDEQLTGRDWSSIGVTVGNAVRNAIRDGIQNAADIFAILLSWVSDQIRGVNWVTVGSTFAELLVGGIKGVVGLIGLAGWLLGQILLAVVEVKWGDVADAIGTFLRSALTALVGFLVGFGTTLGNEISTQLEDVPWGEIGSAIQEYFVSAVAGIGTAIGEAIWSELPGWLRDLISGTADFLGGDTSTQGGGGGTTVGDAPMGGSGSSNGPRQYGDLLNALREIPIAAGAAAASLVTFGQSASNAFALAGSAAAAGLLPIPTHAGTAAGSLTGVLVPSFVTVAISAGANFGAMASTVLSTTAAAASTAGANFGAIAESAIANFSSMRDTGSAQSAGLQASVVAAFATMSAQAGSSLGQMAGNAMTRFSSMRSNASLAGSQIAAAISSGTATAANAAGINLGRLAGIVASNGFAAAESARSAGAAIGEGLASGIDAMYLRVAAAGARLANAAAEAIALAAQVKSPSRVTMRLGEYMGEGLAIGLHRTTGEVAKSGASLVDALTRSLQDVVVGSLITTLEGVLTPTIPTVPWSVGSELASELSDVLDSQVGVLARTIESALPRQGASIPATAYAAPVHYGGSTTTYAPTYGDIIVRAHDTDGVVREIANLLNMSHDAVTGYGA